VIDDVEEEENRPVSIKYRDYKRSLAITPTEYSLNRSNGHCEEGMRASTPSRARSARYSTAKLGESGHSLRGAVAFPRR